MSHLIRLLLSLTLLFLFTFTLILLILHFVHTQGQYEHPSVGGRYGYCREADGYGYWYKPALILVYNFNTHRYTWKSGHLFEELMTPGEYRSCLYCQKSGNCYSSF